MMLRIERSIREIPDEETVYLQVHQADKRYPEMSERYKNTPGSHVGKDRFITTSIETIEHNGWEEDLGYLVLEPSPNHLVRKKYLVTTSSREIEYILMHHSLVDSMKVINNFMENGELVVVGDINVPKEQEEFILGQSNVILPLACSRRSVIIWGLQNSIEKLLKPLQLI